MTVQNLSFSLNLRTLQLGGPSGWVDISDLDCTILRALAQSNAKRVDTGTLLQHAGKSVDTLAKRALGVQLVRLRKKLEKAGAPGPTIKSIRGRGYQLCVPLQIST
jgi:DNA-binding response OmpR family regulator